MERVRVGEVLSIQRRKVAVKPTDYYTEIGVRSFGRGIFHKEPTAGFELGNKRVFLVEPRDLVISNVFAWEGAVALAGPSEKGMVGSHRFMTFVPKDDRLNIAWAAWFFRSAAGLELLRRASPGSAGRNRTLAVDRFESLELHLPDRDSQRLVVSRLDTVEEAVAKLVVTYDRAVLVDKALITSLITRPDLTELVKAHSGWQLKSLHEVLTLSRLRVSVQLQDTYRVAGVYSFGRGMFQRAAIDGSQTSYKVMHQLRAGQLVMSRLKAWEGALALVPDELDGWFVSPEFPTFDVNVNQVDRRYLQALLTSEHFWSRLRSKGMGARRERVDSQKLLEQSVAIPPFDEQVRIATIIDSLVLARSRRASAFDRSAALVPAASNSEFGATLSVSA